MTAEFKLAIYNTSGVKQAEITDFLQLNYIRRVNDVGALQFSLSGDHSLVTTLADKWIVELFWADLANGIDWVSDFVGFYRESEQIGADPGVFWATCTGINALLGWRVVAWPAGVADRSEFISEKAETVAKTLVTYNATASASTANGRLYAGQITGLTVQSDGATGNTINHYCTGENLLESLQRVAESGGGDFNVVMTTPGSYNFQWFNGQLGTVRTTGAARVLFALGLENMGDPYFAKETIHEKTLAFVAGSGEGAAREFVTRTGTNYSAANQHEIWADARNVAPGDTTGLQDKGDEVLSFRESTERFEFDALQTPASMYGKHYFLGDLVLAISPFTGSTVTRKVNEVTVVVQPDGRVRTKIGLANA